MHQPIPVTVELPQHIYDQILLISRSWNKSFNEALVFALESALQNHHEQGYPEYPLGPAPWENKQK